VAEVVPVDERDTVQPHVAGEIDGDREVDVHGALAARVQVDLPRVRPEDMTTSQDVDPPPDPTGGRDVDAEFMIRHIGW
jgi:hypothetical protein